MTEVEPTKQYIASIGQAINEFGVDPENVGHLSVECDHEDCGWEIDTESVDGHGTIDRLHIMERRAQTHAGSTDHTNFSVEVVPDVMYQEVDITVTGPDRQQSD
jgi:hypothetical protein